MKVHKIVISVFLSLSIFLLFSCEKDDKDDKVELEYGSVTDVDGNVYGTVKIGNQWWMTENLKVTSYNDGSKINEVLSTENDSVWAKSDSSSFCKIDDRYGLIYNWYAVADSRKIAPKGWHIPTDEEWKTLEKEIGMSQVEVDKTSWRGVNEAEKLIIKSSEGWVTFDVFGINSFGFTALPGGCRLFNGVVQNNANASFWWTSTLKDNKAYYRNLDSDHQSIFRYFTYKNYGFSVRCLKD
jgi:uncharacterized protein (TIGR02145 family)